MSLRDGAAKMSKSDPSDMSRINLTDDADTMMQKVRKAKTDPEALPSEAAGLEGRPEARNLVGIYAALADTSVDAVLRDHAGQGLGAFKPALGELLIDKLGPINARYVELPAEAASTDAVREQGAETARAAPRPTPQT